MGWPWQKLTGSKQHPDSRCVGIELHRGRAFAVLWSGNAVTSCYTPAEDEQGMAGLEAWLNAQQLLGLPVVISLDTLDYELHLVEAPPVPDNELADALRFRMRDLIALPPDEAQVQAFRMPADAYRGRMDMVFAAVVARPVIRQLVHWCRSMELSLDSITIPELSILSLVATLAPETAVGVLRLDDNDGVIYLYRDGGLYLTRRLNLGTQALLPATADTELTAEHSNQVEALALEVQRSLDFFDSQLGMGMVGEIWVLSPDASDIHDVLPELEKQVNVAVRSFSPGSLFTCADRPLTASLATALGNALTFHARVGAPL